MTILDDDLVQELRKMHSRKESASSMLKKIKSVLQYDRRIKVLAMKYLKEALGWPMSVVTCVPGWQGFGRELTDAQIDELIDSSLDRASRRDESE